MKELFVFTRARFGFDAMDTDLNKDVGVDINSNTATPTPIRSIYKLKKG